MAQDDIQGQVVDASGDPVEGAIVELTRSYQSSPTTEETVVRTTTDSNGNYIFEIHPDADDSTQEWHVSCYNYDGTAYVNSENNPGVTADLPRSLIPDSEGDHQWNYTEGSGTEVNDSIGSLDLDFTSISGWPTDAGVGGTYAQLDGSNDFAILGNDAWTSFITQSEGTFFSWLKLPDDTSQDGDLAGTDLSSDGSDFLCRVNVNDNEFGWTLTIDDNRVDVIGGSPQNLLDEWIATAWVADATDMYLYVADASDDYTIREVASSSAPPSGSGNWDNDVAIGTQGDGLGDRALEAGIDLQFFDSIGQSQSQIQSFVDSSKRFYD